MTSIDILSDTLDPTEADVEVEVEIVKEVKLNTNIQVVIFTDTFLDRCPTIRVQLNGYTVANVSLVQLLESEVSMLPNFDNKEEDDALVVSKIEKVIQYLKSNFEKDQK